MPFLGGRGQASRGYFGGGTTPDAPTSLVSTKGNGEISVAFTAPGFDGGLPITTYQYALSTSNYETFITRSTGTTASPLVITGLTNGTSVGVRIRAVNSLGAGAAGIAAAEVIPSTVPNAPTITSSPSHVNGQVTVTWNALTGADTGGAGILSYTLQHSASSTFASGVVTVTSIASTSHPVTGLTNGTTRYFKVLGVNLNGDGAYSGTASATPSTVPSAPATPTVTALDAGDTITWTAPATGGRAITGYYYKVSTNDGAYSGETFVAAGATLSYATGNQYSASTFKIQVRAVNDNGTSDFSTVSANTVAWTYNDSTVTQNQNDTSCGTGTCSQTGAAIACECGYQNSDTVTRTASRTRSRTVQTTNYSRPGSTTSASTITRSIANAEWDLGNAGTVGYSAITYSPANFPANTYGACDNTGTNALKTGNFSQGGLGYTYTGTPGEYSIYPHPFCSNGCDFSVAYFTVTTCSTTNLNTITYQNIDVCRNVFGDAC